MIFKRLQTKPLCYLCRRYSKAETTKNKWESVVGLEVHAQISASSKLFSGASTEFASPVNTNVSLFDAAIPGTLPVLNRRCVESGVLTALALSCSVNAVSMFDRKHYFYADLPAGYQITQQRSPLASSGHLEFQVFTPGVHRKPYTTGARIKQIQLEQDSGRSLHDEEAGRSLVDLNRAGVSLMELVFEPDLKDGEEAAALVKELSIILERLGTCSCKMEEGALRVDANVSVNRPGDALGVRSEIKNIASIRGVASAIKYEIQRQIHLLESGEKVINETRAWDAQQKITVPMRDKEQVQDYRYMPEPNLPPLHLKLKGIGPPESVDVDVLQGTIPELPKETRSRLQEEYALSLENVIVLVNESVLLKYFETITSESKCNPKVTANILINELLTFVNRHKLELDGLNVEASRIGELINLLHSKTVNLLIARKVLEEMLKGNKSSPAEIVEVNKWTMVTDEQEVMNLCETVLTENPKIVRQYKSGKVKVFKALLGLIAKKSEQRVDMALVSKILKNLLDNDK